MKRWSLLLVGLSCLTACHAGSLPQSNARQTAPSSASPIVASPALRTPSSRPLTSQRVLEPRTAKLVAAAVRQFGETTLYDPAYVRLEYPNGDPPRDRGVCSDVVIRALRGAGVNLQRLVHEDMRAHFAAYPQLWGLRVPDRNIDHRRVANLMTFLARGRKSQPVSAQASDYQPGDIVAWRLPGGRLHIGVVTDRFEPGSTAPLLAHNIGAGVQLEPMLFAWPVIGHYRYF